MQSRKFLFPVVVLCCFFAACSRHRHVVRVPVSPPPSSPTQAEAPSASAETRDGKSGTHQAEAQHPAEECPCYTEVGYASWYGDPYHGRRAANGEIYDKFKLTAAHLTLPFGTEVKVIDLENNRSVSVRITDRGPFVKGRIIDLSLAAARAIQMVGPGTALVRLEVLSMPAEPDLGSFAVQVGAFRDRSTAERLRDRLMRRYGNVSIESYRSDDGLFYRVRVGPKSSLSQATQLAKQLGQERLGTFVVRVDD